MVKRTTALYALVASLSALLMSSCGGGGGESMPVAAKACDGGGACVSTLAGTGEHGNLDGATATAQFSMPHSVVIDAQSNVHVADYGNNNLTRLIAQGNVSTPSEDPIAFPHPQEVATDASGNRYVADRYGNRILKTTPAGETTVLAGTGQSGDSDGDAATASFSMPAGLAFDADGVLYVADMGNGKIRKITLN